MALVVTGCAPANMSSTPRARSVHPPRWRGRRSRPELSAAERAARAERRRTLKQDALNLPNLLTFGRIGIIPLVLWLIDRGSPRDCLWAAIVYALACLTDLVDGYLARRLNVVSVLGKFLDPLADKLLVTAVLVWMVPMGRIAEWAVVLLLSRELAVTGLRSLASSEGMVIAAGDDGKSKTALQMVGILSADRLPLSSAPWSLRLGHGRSRARRQSARLHFSILLAYEFRVLCVPVRRDRAG